MTASGFALILTVLGPITVSSVHAAGEEVLPPGIVSKEEPKTFVEAISKINATPAFFEALAKRRDTGPTINLNFLRYRPRGNGERYGLYGAVAGAEIVALGGDIVYHGEGVTDMGKGFDLSDEWDAVAYAMYPTSAAYIELQQNINYQMAIPDRVAGNYERMLYLLSDGEAIYDAAHSISAFHENCTRVSATATDVVISELLRFKKPDGRKTYEEFAAAFAPMLTSAGGEALLSVRAEMPIVSEEHWDHFVAFRFPSIVAMTHLYQSDGFSEIKAKRIAALDDTLVVLSETEIIPAKECE